MPRVLPVVNNNSRPLCANDLIMMSCNPNGYTGQYTKKRQPSETAPSFFHSCPSLSVQGSQGRRPGTRFSGLRGFTAPTPEFFWRRHRRPGTTLFQSGQRPGTTPFLGQRPNKKGGTSFSGETAFSVPYFQAHPGIGPECRGRGDGMPGRWTESRVLPGPGGMPGCSLRAECPGR